MTNATSLAPKSKTRKSQRLAQKLTKNYREGGEDEEAEFEELLQEDVDDEESDA
jgi:hypothetical protein